MKGDASKVCVVLLMGECDNKNGDAGFDGTREPMRSVALEGDLFISSYNRGQAKKVASRLRPGTTRMDGPLAQLVAMREGVNAVVAGARAPKRRGHTEFYAERSLATGGTPLQKDQNHPHTQKAVR